MKKFCLLVLGLVMPVLLCGVSGCDEWRSSLYPLDWEPGYKDAGGRFLHDFSYAGYKNGEESLPNISGPVFDVTGNGADDTGNVDSTGAIQATINQAQNAGGGVVFFPKGLYRVEGTLSVTHSNMVLRGEGSANSRIFFTQYQGMNHKAHLSFQGNVATDGNWLFSQDGKNLDDHVVLGSTSGLSVGDEVALGIKITDDFRAEHGMSKY